MVVPRSPSGSTALCSQAVVPPLGSTTVSGFCYFRLFAEVGTEVPLPPGWDFCLAVVPHGGRGSTARAKVLPPAPACLFIFTVARVAAVPWVGTVVPHSRAVVPLGCKQ